MNIKEYHEHKALGASSIKRILENPTAFALGVNKIQTIDMALGDALHRYVLEPDKFDDDFVVTEPYDGRTKAGKELKAKYELDDRVKITEEHLEAIEAMALNISSLAGALLSNGVAEKSVFSEIDGVEVKCRPDYYIEGLGLVIDLKKSISASPDGFERAIASYGYYIQAAHYLRTMRSAGLKADKFIFIAVEPTPPYMVGVYELDEASLQLGNDEVDRAIEIYKNLDRYKKPIYRDTKTMEIAQVLSVPNWVYYKKGVAI